MKTFEELDCWKKSTELRRQLAELVKGFPHEEKYKRTDQIVRASRSVTANIAEGFSRGSLYELIDHLIVARDENYISTEQYDRLKAEIDLTLAVLNGFINYLLKAKER